MRRFSWFMFFQLIKDSAPSNAHINALFDSTDREFLRKKGSKFVQKSIREKKAIRLNMITHPIS